MVEGEICTAILKFHGPTVAHSDTRAVRDNAEFAIADLDTLLFVCFDLQRMVGFFSECSAPDATAWRQKCLCSLQCFSAEVAGAMEK